jgi:hypothetical protein
MAGKFFCKWCGMGYPDARSLVMDNCPNNPDNAHPHKHELYEGGVKPQYFCKYCGLGFKDLRNLTHNRCQNHPLGHLGHNHEPAL